MHTLNKTSQHRRHSWRQVFGGVGGGGHLGIIPLLLPEKSFWPLWPAHKKLHFSTLLLLWSREDHTKTGSVVWDKSNHPVSIWVSLSSKSESTQRELRPICNIMPQRTAVLYVFIKQLRDSQTHFEPCKWPLLTCHSWRSTTKRNCWFWQMLYLDAALTEAWLDNRGCISLTHTACLHGNKHFFSPLYIHVLCCICCSVGLCTYTRLRFCVRLRMWKQWYDAWSERVGVAIE